MTYFSVVSVAVSTTRRVALCALLGLCLLAGLLSQAGAAAPLPTFTVTRTADDLSPGSLRSAIAQAAAGGGTVVFNIPTTDPGVSNGTATITLLLGPLVVPSSLSIVGPNMPSGAIVVSGGTGANQSRIFSVTGGMVAFSNLTITNGNASQSNVNFPESGGGGGILNSANLTLTNCAVTGNSANPGNGPTAGGAGINNSGTGASLTMTNCTVSGNTIQFGGNGGGIANSGTLLLTRCTVTGNSVDSNGSGGGGLFNTSTATLNACSLSGNNVTGQFGLGGGAYSYGSMTLNNCLVNGNSAGLEGGGIVAGSSDPLTSTLTLSACTISNNTGGLGGGISNSATALITNCLVVGNSGLQVGGMYDGGGLTLINSTFTGNRGSGSTPVGGLISAEGTLVNDIFYFDTSTATGTAPPSEVVAASGRVGPTVTFSDVQGGDGNGNDPYPGTGNIDADPHFFRNPFTNGSGDIGDEHLRFNSPVVHTGTNGTGVPFTDIEGTPRPTPPARPSMGAYEIPGSSGGFRAQGGFTITGTQNVSTGTQVVAQFLPGTTPVSSFTASVDMGDGSVIPGVISPDPTANGVFNVTVSHTYTSPGTFPITVVISGPNNTPTATVTSAANIQPILASLSFPSSVECGSIVTATVTLTGVTSSDIVVGTGSSDPSIVRINRGIIIPAGSSSATFAINTFRSHITKTVTITATSGQVALTKNLTITGR